MGFGVSETFEQICCSRNHQKLPFLPHEPSGLVSFPAEGVGFHPLSTNSFSVVSLGNAMISLRCHCKDYKVVKIAKGHCMYQ